MLIIVCSLSDSFVRVSFHSFDCLGHGAAAYDGCAASECSGDASFGFGGDGCVNRKTQRQKLNCKTNAIKD